MGWGYPTSCPRPASVGDATISLRPSAAHWLGLHRRRLPRLPRTRLPLMVPGEPQADSRPERPDGASSSPDPRRQALVESLRHRYRSAVARGDAAAKQALFKEAVYLGIQPDAFTGGA